MTQAMKRAVIGLAAACLGTGCSPHRRPPLSAPPPAGTAQWRIAFSVTPNMPRQLDPAQFQVKLTDTHKKPVRGAAVTVRLAMPAMDMGRNDVGLREATPGIYIGTGRFTMPGDWQATVSADKGTAHQSQTAAVSVQ